MSKYNLEILMPVYNEEDTIKETLSQIYKKINKEISFRFIISEDGSTDDTKNILNNLKLKYNLKLISDKKRKGYSKAVMDGIKSATADYLLIMDSDGQCDPRDIKKLWNQRKNSDLVSGNRVQRKDFMYRKIFSNACYLIYKILFNVNLKDPSFAFILMNKKVYKSLVYKVLCPQGFFWEFNARAKIKNFTFNEVNVNHRKRKSGHTRIYYYRDLPKIALQHFLGLMRIKFLK
jgi:glycosyltransferase involved in cell wall biosynthesis